MAFSGDNDVVDSVLYDVSGSALAVSSSTVVASTQPMLISAGLSGSVVRPIRLDDVGSTFVTGSVAVAQNASSSLVTLQTYDGRQGTQLTSENVLGVMLRASHPSGSYEIGVENNPIIIHPPEHGHAAFGESRVVQPYTLFDHVNRYEIDSSEIQTSASNGGTVTYVSASGVVRLSATATSGSLAQLRTNTYFRYQAGKGHHFRMSAFCGDVGQTGQRRSWGYFDENDGVFFMLDGTTLSLVKRSSVSGNVVDVIVPQSSWNVDKLDGTGKSGVVLVPSFANIYEASLQWLGVGSVRWFVNQVLVHVSEHANQFSDPYMRTAQLPLSFEIRNMTAVSSATGSINLVCMSLFSEGGTVDPQYSFAAYNQTDVSVTPTERPLLTIRPKLQYAGQTNRILLLPKKGFVSTEGSRAGFRVVLNGTLTGASFVSVADNSGAEYDVSATALTGGQTLYRGFLPNSNDGREIDLEALFSTVSKNLKVSAFADSQSTLTIMGVNEAAGTALMRSSFAWGEVR